MPYEADPTTLGEHMLKRRYELGLEQKEVATMLGVTSFTVLNWEKDRRWPDVRHVPRIIDFLGYVPFPEPKTMGELIASRRRSMGLDQRQFAKLIGVDPSSIYHWERDDRKPTGPAGMRLEQFLDRN